MSNTNNVVIVKSLQRNIAYTNLITPNFIVSTDERIFRQANSWFENLLDKADALSLDALSLDAAKYRTAYFRRLRRSIGETKWRIEVINRLL